MPKRAGDPDSVHLAAFPEARNDHRTQEMIADFPESPLAADAKKISDALRKGGS